ncbi:MAG: hypothetical protein H6R26_2811 [Proteobacteria bacterium]|nr:hypothetical protein [Pseudomonadota bacterium]
MFAQCVRQPSHTPAWIHSLATSRSLRADLLRFSSAGEATVPASNRACFTSREVCSFSRLGKRFLGPHMGVQLQHLQRDVRD